ncbi:MAG: nucleotidyltransferase family protein, partial [Fervidicoccus sp.]
MVSLIYLSHNEIESVYPITESGEPLPNLKLLGKPIGVRVIESFENEGINDMSVYYSNISSEVYELIGKRVKLEETGKLDFLNSLKNAVENSNSQEIILVLGSFLLNEGFIRELLYKWNEKGSSMLIALVPGSQKLEDLVWKIGVDVEFVEGNVKKAYLIKNNASSFYIFSGIIVSEKEFLLRKIDLSIKDYNQALLKLINETNPPFYIYTGEYVSFASPWSILNAMKMLLQKISGQFISKEAKVSPTAVLEGP